MPINGRRFASILNPILIEGLQKIVDWYKSNNSYYLRSIFDLIGFMDRSGEGPFYYALPTSLSTRLVYPVKGNEEALKKARDSVLSEIELNYHGFSNHFIATLDTNQLFFLLEKFGGSIPLDEKGVVSIFDAYKIKAAREVIKSNRADLGHSDNLFISVDLSGIQRVIYNIISAGAVKNLRSRSFFIELLCDHIILNVLEAFDLHYANVLMNGGGSILLLSSCPEDYENRIVAMNYGLNGWLLKEFEGRLHAAFSSVKCSDEEIEGGLSENLRRISKLTFEEKQRKFSLLVTAGDFPFEEDKDPWYPGCEVCYKDNVTSKFYPVRDAEGRYRCALCHKLIALGNQIPHTRFIYRHDRDTRECLQIENSNYLLSSVEKPGLQCLWVVYEDGGDFIKHLKGATSHIFLKTYMKRNKDLPGRVYQDMVTEREHLQTLLNSESDEGKKLLLRDDLDALEDQNAATLEFIADSAEGAKLIGALRMDADNVGKIIYDGFYGNPTLEDLSSFSRNMNYFFKLHLESLCKEGFDRQDENDIFSIGDDNGRNLHTIYAGGDDLFVLGSWSDTAALAMDIGEAFRKFTCDNIDIGVSGGLTVHHTKYPVNKMAEESLSGLAFAKRNYQSCWMCRKSWLECPLFELGSCKRKDSVALFFSDFIAFRKERLDEMHKVPKYAQESSRLVLALKWRRYENETKDIVEEVNEYVVKPLRAFRLQRAGISRVFFHNVLSLLNTWYDEGLIYLPKIAWLLLKFKEDLRKHIHDIENGRSLYELYEMYLHLHERHRISTLHIPLTWNILQMRGGNKDENQTHGRKTLGGMGSQDG